MDCKLGLARIWRLVSASSLRFILEFGRFDFCWNFRFRGLFVVCKFYIFFFEKWFSYYLLYLLRSRVWTGWTHSETRKKVKRTGVISISLYFLITAAWTLAKFINPSFSSDYIVGFYALVVIVIVSGLLVGETFFYDFVLTEIFFILYYFL